LDIVNLAIIPSTTIILAERFYQCYIEWIIRLLNTDKTIDDYAKEESQPDTHRKNKELWYNELLEIPTKIITGVFLILM